MVLIGIGEIAYRRDDGVYVVPIGCLKDSNEKGHNWGHWTIELL